MATRQFIRDDLALLSSEVKELHVYAKLDGFDAVSFVIDISFENQFHPTDVDFEDVSGRYDVVELALSFADILSVQVDFEAFDLQRCLQNSHKLWHFILLIEKVPQPHLVSLGHQHLIIIVIEDQVSLRHRAELEMALLGNQVVLVHLTTDSKVHDVVRDL